MHLLHVSGIDQKRQSAGQMMSDSDDFLAHFNKFVHGSSQSCRKCVLVTEQQDRQMRVIGFDPGLRRTGWGVVDSVNGRLHHVGNGTCTTGKGDLAVRLAELHAQVEAMCCARFEPGSGRSRAHVRQQGCRRNPQTRPGPRDLATGPGTAWPACGRICAERRQESGGRRRPCRQGAGSTHDRDAAARAPG